MFLNIFCSSKCNVGTISSISKLEDEKKTRNHTVKITRRDVFNNNCTFVKTEIEFFVVKRVGKSFRGTNGCLSFPDVGAREKEWRKRH